MLRYSLWILALTLSLPALAKAGPPQPAHLELAARYSASKRGVSLLVLHRGKVIFERYANRGGPQKAHRLASGTKSFAGVAALFAVQDGLLTLDEPVSKTILAWKADARRAITIRQLLNLTCGLEDRVAGARRFKLSYSQALRARSVKAPGSAFSYSGVPFQVFGEVLRRKLKAKGHKTVRAYLQVKLFTPLKLGVESWKEIEGQSVLPHGASLSARNWAKFGEWLRQGGKHQGQQLLPAKLLASATQGTPQNPAYGLCFWLNRPVSAQLKRGVPVFQVTDLLGHPLVPKDTYMAAGAGDQRLFVIPSLELVVVRQARGILAAMLGRRSGYTDANLLARLLHGKDASGKALKTP